MQSSLRFWITKSENFKLIIYSGINEPYIYLIFDTFKDANDIANHWKNWVEGMDV